MAFAAHTEQTALSVSTTELSLVSGTSTLQTVTNAAGFFVIWIDCSNLAKGDEFALKIYETVRASGTKRLAYRAVLADAQSQLIFTYSMGLLNGWDVTLQRIAGSDRTFDTSIRRVS
jgi:hypothetical protein